MAKTNPGEGNRVVLHVDMNAYFASVEQANNPFLRGKPIAVGGGVGGKRTIVATASYEAKARGVKTAMPAWEALKICPDLIIVPGDMTKYIYTSAEIIKILKQYTDLIEVFSIDEAFLDITATKDRFGGEISLAKQIKQAIRERFRLTCSIGIAPNKFLAKLAGELKKPDGLTIIKPEDIPGKIDKVPVATLCGVGRKLEKYLSALGIFTFGHLHRYPRQKLVKRFGPATGEHLWQMGQGEDHSVILPYPQEDMAKSMGHSYTLPKRTSDVDEVKGYLMRLCEQVGRRLRKEHYKGNIIHLVIGFDRFDFWGKQKKIDDYINDGYEIFKVAEKLISLGAPRLKASAPKNQGDQDIQLQFPEPIRFISITLSGLSQNLDQLSLLPNQESAKLVLKAVDAINDRFGEFTVERAAIMRTAIHNKTGLAPPSSYKNLN